MPHYYRIGPKPPPGKTDRRPWGVRWEAGRDRATGKRRQPSRQPFPSQREAIAWYEEHVAGKRTRASSTMPLGDYLDRWHKGLRLAPNTIRAYRYAVEHIRAHLGDIRLRDLRRVDVRDWHAAMAAEGYADNTMRLHHMVLVSALSRAVDDELLMAHPAAGMIPAPRPPSTTPHWDAESVRRFLRLTDPHRREPLWEALPFQIMVLTGLRPGECRHLRWADVDLERGVLSVPDAKTPAGVRALAVPERLRVILRLWRPAQLEARLAAPSWDEHGVIVTSPKHPGRPLSDSGMRSRMRRLCRELGLPVISPHGLRHSYASWMAALGVHPLIVQHALGHRSLDMTLGTYSHVSEGMTREAADRLDAALSDDENADGAARVR